MVGGWKPWSMSRLAMSRVRTPGPLLDRRGRGHELVLAGAVVRDVERPGEPVLQVVGREDRVVADLGEPRPAVGADVRVRAHEDAGVADEAAQPPDRGRALPLQLEPEGAVVAAEDARRGEERDQPVADADRSGAGAAAAVGRAERLVDIEVHDVEAGLAGLEAAQDRVQVRAVHVRERARLVDRVEQLADPRLEEAERRGVGDHHGGGPRAERGPERVDVDAAVRGGRDRDRREAGHRRGRRVRAVRAGPARAPGRARRRHAPGDTRGSSGSRSARPAPRPRAGG